MGAGPIYRLLSAALVASRPVLLATVVEGPSRGQRALVGVEGVLASTIADEELARAVAGDAVSDLAAGGGGLRRYGPRGGSGGEVVVFMQRFGRPPRMLVLGATDFTAALVRVAKVLGFRVTVCDAREVFANPRRFPDADEVVVRWPHLLIEELGRTLGPDDAICVLTHDARFDVPAIMAALATDVGYLGALGSRSTHARRVELLEAAGAGEADLARLRAPIGLDLGARTPEETAVAICAEIIAARSGRAAEPLAHTRGPIH